MIHHLRHRGTPSCVEMLQNRPERSGGVEAKFRLLTGKELAMSPMSQFFGSRLGHYVIAVLVTWISIFAIGYLFYGPTPGRPALHAFAGFLPGMLAMYFATRLYGTPQNSISHFFRSRFDICVIGILVAWIFLFVIGYYFYGPTRGHPALQVFGGFLLGTLAMHIGTHVYGMP